MGVPPGARGRVGREPWSPGAAGELSLSMGARSLESREQGEIETYSHENKPPFTLNFLPLPLFGLIQIHWELALGRELSSSQSYSCSGRLTAPPHPGSWGRELWCPWPGW